MVPDPRLQALHDVHLPDAITTWPWAPGWFVLLGGGCLLLGAGLIWVWRRHQHALPKKMALKLLKDLETTFNREKNSAQAIAALNQLLKRVALVYHSRAQVAALYGQEWVQFLNATSKKLDFFTVADLLLTGAYQVSVDSATTKLSDPQSSSHAENMVTLFRLSRAWIQQRGQPCSS